ncbi:MAG: DNA polymerase I [Thermoguttaceae bacterium]
MAKRLPQQQKQLFDSQPEADPPSTPTADSPTEVLTALVTVAATPPPDTLEGRKVYVIDSHSLIHQVFHALPEMTSPQGEPVGAVFGFARDLFYLLEQKRPDYLFCAFDLPGKTFRHQLYEQYKGHRPEMDVDLAPQFGNIRKVVEAMGIPALGLESFEADDVLATVARLTGERGGQCFLVTADKDCRQLITDQVLVYNIRKDQVIDREALKADWGIAPEQVIDFQALVGDSVDNVPGVPLIGPKGAQQLLQHFGTLDALYQRIDELPNGKKKQNLIAAHDQALLSRNLVRLDCQVPVPVDWEAGRVGRIDRPRLRELFQRFGFRSLVEKVDALASQFGEAAPAGKQLELRYRLVDTPEALAALVEELGQQKSLSVDLETTNIWPRWAEIVGIALAWNDTEGCYLPVRGPAGEKHLDLAATLDALRPILENPAIEKVGQNLKYDMIVLRSNGILLAGVGFDTMVASYLLDAGERTHNLDDLAKHYLGHTTIKISELIGTGKNQKRMDEVPIRLVTDYAGEDAVLPLHLRPILAPRLAEAKLEKLFTDVEMPLIDVLVELEYNGIKVDVQRLAELSRRFGERIAAVEREIHELAGRELNIASPKQLQQVLFQDLKLPVIKKTKTGPSTDAEVLEELAAVHPLPAKIVEYRQYTKLKSTYVDALPQMVNPKTGRVHASFHQAVTATGRLSSSDPNLQNIPVRTEEGREIRSAFVPGEPGWQLVAADYSQIELRVLAHYSGDEQLREAFARDEDIHARVASQIYGVPLAGVTPDMRRQAKTVNFGVIYGQSPFGLAKELRIEKQAAAQFIEAYFAGYPGIEKFLNRVLADCQQSGYVSTVLGRRRAIRGVRAEAGRQRNLAERTAINTVIQGSAADLIKLAMLAIHRRLKTERLAARMLLQIHDELIFEAPAEEVDTLAALVAQEMAAAHPLDVPLKVDVKTGPNWADAKGWNTVGKDPSGIDSIALRDSTTR